jgi:threonine dehydrogenase-like Zn-dependent dehydrogenase
MRAVTVNYTARRVEEAAVPAPVPGLPGEVLLRVVETGVCGTDRELAAFAFGAPPPGADYLILGHEAVAEVAETGPGLQRFRKGDLVTPTIRRPCAAGCATCRRNRADLCLTLQYRERGITGLHGFFTEFAVEHQDNLVAVPPRLAGAAVLAEPLSVVEKALDRALAVREEPPRTALVLGAGPVGLLTALACRHRGITPSLHSLEPASHPRARLAERCGARYLERLEGVFDLVIEATGSAAAAFAGIGRLGPLGVCVVLGPGVGTGELSFLDFVVSNQSVVGCVNASPASFARAVDDLGRFDPEVLARMITRVPFGDYPASFAPAAAESVKRVHVIH